MSDSARAQSVYRGVLSQAGIPAGSKLHCPQASGVSYTVTFLSGATVLLAANVEPDGCEFVTSSQLGNPLLASAELWQTLASGLGIEERSIYPFVAHP